MQIFHDFPLDRIAAGRALVTELGQARADALQTMLKQQLDERKLLGPKQILLFRQQDSCDTVFASKKHVPSFRKSRF